MKYGFVLPWGDARTAADFAYEAEQAGWDGFFVWEPVWGVDAWVSGPGRVDGCGQSVGPAIQRPPLPMAGQPLTSPA